MVNGVYGNTVAGFCIAEGTTSMSSESNLQKRSASTGRKYTIQVITSIIKLIEVTVITIQSSYERNSL